MNGEKRQVTISTFEGIIEALGSSDTAVRAATVNALAKNPSKVLEIAERDGRDIVKELRGLIKDCRDHSVRRMYVFALLMLDKEGDVSFAKEEFSAGWDGDILIAAAQKLTGLPESERVEFFTPFLMQDGDQTKSRIAANLLAYCKGLTVKEAIRAAVLSDHDVHVPAVDDANIDEWLEALQGAYPFRSWEMLAKDSESVKYLFGIWGSLPRSVRLMLVKEADGHQQKIGQILHCESDRDIIIAGLKAVGCPAGLEDSFIAHDDPEIRALAVSLGVKSFDWALMLKEEPSEKVRTAIAQRIGSLKDASFCGLLSGMLSDKSWRVRAAAVNSLAVLAPESVPFIKERADDSDDNVRVACSKAMKLIGI